MILAICGYGGHGKGTAATYLAANSKLRYKQSTSMAAGEMMFRKIGEKYGYPNAQACWEDRHNHRAEWAEEIWAYNQPDGLTLYREMLPDNDILEGVRKAAELQALKDAGIITMTLWVDALERLPREPSSSCQVKPTDADAVIDNNKGLAHLYEQLDLFIKNPGRFVAISKVNFS
jgi:hypothetical protein